MDVGGKLELGACKHTPYEWSRRVCACTHQSRLVSRQVPGVEPGRLFGFHLELFFESFCHIG